jgi:hypothetical protein
MPALNKLKRLSAWRKGLNLQPHQYYGNLMVALRRNETGDRLPNRIMDLGQGLIRGSLFSRATSFLGGF